MTEIEGPGYADERRWYVTVIDPFDFVGMVKGRNMNQRFWATHEAGRQAAKDPAADVENGKGIVSEVTDR